MTRRQFSEETGVSESSLHRLIHGKADFFTGTIRKVSEGTGNEVTELQLYEAWYAARCRLSAGSGETVEAAGS